MAGWVQTERGEITHGNLNLTLWHTLAIKTSSNLSATPWSGCELSHLLLSRAAGIFAFWLAVFGAAAGVSAEVTIACEEPSREATGLVVVRCNLVSGGAVGAWRASFEGSERVCVGLPSGLTLPAGPGPQCGTVGEAVWFWRRLTAPERGSLRYRSWVRDGVWRAEGADMLPARLWLGPSVVTSGDWEGSAVTPYSTFRDRTWLRGSVSSTRDDGVRLEAEPAVAGFAAAVLEELRRLRAAGQGEAVRNVEVLAAARQDYASGRSGPGWLVLEVGAGAKAERVGEVVRHEVAHQLVGGSIRYVRSGSDVGWFLEGFAEYLGFAMSRGERVGRTGFFRRFGEACEAVSQSTGQVSEYDLGFLYAAAVDGALWRRGSTGLSERLAALVAGRAEPVIFGGREDFLGNEARVSLVTALLAGASDAGAERARGWMEREERPDVAVLAGDLGVVLGKESMTMDGLPVSMRERRDGLFEVTSVEGPVAAAGGLAAGDLVWPLAAWSGAGPVAVEVSRPYGWQRVTLATRRQMRQRWRVVSVGEAQARWFDAGAGGPTQR